MIQFFKDLISQQRLNLLKNEAGAVILLYALAVIPVFGMLGLAIDGGRIFYVNSIITGAADAAAVAGAKAGGTNANIIQNATVIFNANIPQNFIGTLNGPSVSVTTNVDGSKVVNVTATGTIDTTFMKLLGHNSIAASSTSAAVVAVLGTEITLALDNTGSMFGSPMQAEIDAAKLLVETVYGGPGVNTVQGLYFAVVPYSTTVNIGMTGFNPVTWLTPAGVAQVANPLLYPNIAPNATSVGGRWMGCIEARTPPIYAAGMDETDAVPAGGGLFTPFLYPSTRFHKYIQGQPFDRVSPLGSRPWSASTRGDNDWNLDGSVPGGSGLRFGDNYAWRGSDGNLGVGPNLGCPIPILPLTAAQSTVQSTLSNMKASFRGGTMINIGLAAAWWTISPNWVGRWPGTPANLPGPYATTRKFLILMTDGVNQWYDWPTGVPGQPGSGALGNDADYTGYGRLSEGRAGTTVFSQTSALLNTRMSRMCTTIKNNDVVVYTILFTHGGGIDAGTQAAFRNCATDPSKYYFAATNADLIAAFKDIAKSITSLRLTWPGKS